MIFTTLHFRYCSFFSHSNVTGEYHPCHMYDYDYATVAEMGYEMAKREGLLGVTNLTVECSRHDFNYTQYESTTVTEVSQHVIFKTIITVRV